MSWQDRAACARHRLDPEPPYGAGAGLLIHRYAAAYCAGCPVLAECARDALAHRDIGVVRAGVYCAPNGVSQRVHVREALQQAAGHGV